MSCSVPNEECGEQPNAALCGCMPRFMFMAKFDVSILSATLSSLGLLVWVFAQRKTGGRGGGLSLCMRKSESGNDIKDLLASAAITPLHKEAYCG